MRIGLDIDDTICDTFEYLLPDICKFYNLDYKKIQKQHLDFDYFANKYSDYYEYAKKSYNDFIPHVPLKKGVIKYLKKIKAAGHEIIFITARSKRGYDNPYQTTYDYLIRNGIPFDELIVDAQDKGTVCLEEKIDIFIDDNIKNYDSVRFRGINAYLFTDKSNEKYNVVNRVKSFRQLYKIVKGRKYGRR